MGNTDYIIDIAVDTCFLDDQSAPEEGRFVFAYTVQTSSTAPRARVTHCSPS